MWWWDLEVPPVILKSTLEGKISLHEYSRVAYSYINHLHFIMQLLLARLPLLKDFLDITQNIMGILDFKIILWPSVIWAVSIKAQ